MGWRRKKKKEPKSEIESERGEMLLRDLIECCDGKSNPIKLFSADEILKATNHFSDSNHVKELADIGIRWYSGKNEIHHKIFIKKFFRYKERKFYRDITVSSMVSGHKNFLKLVGCCLETEYPLMVYQGVKKHYRIDLEKQPWKMRMKIAEDIATALSYLHTAFPRPFIYRCLSHHNILLDEDGVARLNDFSFCVSIPKGETFVQVDRLVGRINYLDDKYWSSSVVSEETDVFAIGILMQTLLIGDDRLMEFLREKQETDGVEKEQVDGPGRRFQYRVLKFMKEQKMDEIADPEMGESSQEEICQMKAFLMLSLRCTGLRGEVPTMVEVAKELKKIQKSLLNDTSSLQVKPKSTILKTFLPQSSSSARPKNPKRIANAN